MTTRAQVSDSTFPSDRLVVDFSTGPADLPLLYFSITNPNGDTVLGVDRNGAQQIAKVMIEFLRRSADL